MSHSLTSAVIGALVGGIVGAGLALTIGGGPAETAPPLDDERLAAAMASAMSGVEDRLEDGLRGLRRDIVSIQRRENAASNTREVEGASAPSGAPAVATAGVGTSGDEAVPVLRAEIKSADMEQLAELQTWKDSPDLRHKWLFATESELRRHFGIPHRIAVGDSGETWQYYLESGGVIIATFSFQMNRGRVVDFGHKKESGRRSIPNYLR